MNFDFFVPGTSWLHRLDARIKLLLTVCLMTTLLCTANIGIVVGTMVLIHILLITAHVPGKKIAWAWRMMLPVIILIILLWPFFYRSGSIVLVQWGWLRISLESIVQGIMMALRITGMGFSCFVLLFTTDQTRIVRGLVKLGLPYKFGLMFATALRYLPTFFGVIGTVTDAQRARGLDLGGRNPMRKMSAYLPILVAVVISSLKMSDNLSNALESRAFGVSGKDRTYLHDLVLTRTDVMVGVVVLALTCWYLFMRMSVGFGGELIAL